MIVTLLFVGRLLSRSVGCRLIHTTVVSQVPGNNSNGFFARINCEIAFQTLRVDF